MAVIVNGAMQDDTPSRVLTIAAAEATSSGTYSLLTTPDKITSVTLPTAGFIAVWYFAEWKNATISDGRAAIFLNDTQVTIADTASAGPTGQAVSGNSTADTYRPLVAQIGGLASSASATAYTGNSTTGQIYAANNTASNGGPTYIFAAAGTYDVSVRFRSAAGNAAVTVKNRTLRVQVLPFVAA